MVKSILKIAYREHAICLRELEHDPVYQNLKFWETFIIYNGGTIDTATKPRAKTAQRFLLSPAAQSLSLEGVSHMTDEEAYRTFQRIRWYEHGGKPRCPRCGCIELYVCRAEHRWKCKDCTYRFSVTSGTVFANRKMPIRDILAAIAIVANGEKQISALQLSRKLDVQYKTAWDLAHRIRGSTPRSTVRRAAESHHVMAREKRRRVTAC
jgi:transposase-like protein